ncbi:hypothetical protein BVY01_02305 [bacterium I07]|nr:hypothetical protein BVY01_02305 [bacterium I07]
MKTVNFLLCVLIILSYFSCSEESKIQEQYKDLIIRANDEMLNKGNLDFADEVFATNYGNRGPVYVKEMMSEKRTAFPDIHVSIDLLVAEGNMISWRRTNTGTHEGEFMGVPATGKKIKWRDMVVSRIVNKKIVEEWGVSNFGEKIRQPSTNTGTGAEKDIEAIKEVADRIAKALNENNPKMTMDLYSDNAIMIPYGKQAIIGKEAIRVRNLYREGSVYNVTYPVEDIRLFGEWALMIGALKGTWKKDAETDIITVNNWSINILHRQPDNSWKMTYNMFNKND